MWQGTACDFGLTGASATNLDRPTAKLKLEHQEERVRNRYRRFNICIAFALASALSLQAQSDRVDVPQPDSLQSHGDSGQLVAANLVGGSAVSGTNRDSDLPDAPGATKPDASTPDTSAAAAPSPVVRKESQGAPVAAQGGPLWVDRGVADRKYFLVSGGMVGASIMNAELTLHCLNTHVFCNDVPSSLKNRSAIYGIGIPADLGIMYLTYTLKRKHNHMWYVPAAAVTGANLFFAYRAYHWSQEHSIP
jgi:hypothetical protein